MAALAFTCVMATASPAGMVTGAFIGMVVAAPTRTIRASRFGCSVVTISGVSTSVVAGGFSVVAVAVTVALRRRCVCGNADSRNSYHCRDDQEESEQFSSVMRIFLCHRWFDLHPSEAKANGVFSLDLIARIV